MNMVEKVARTLEDLPEHAGPYEWARTAIEAMRVPTEEMYVSGDHEIIAHLSSQKIINGEQTPAVDCWQAMIDEALKEEAK